MVGVTLEVYEYGRGVARNRLVACPLCGYSFDEHERRWKHFLDEHSPEDAGLTSVGDRATLTDLAADDYPARVAPDADGPPVEFVPASRLYDPATGERTGYFRGGDRA